jgi:hypothetical protein
MNEREKLDEWADAFLDQHRSSAARAAGGDADLDAHFAARLEATRRVHRMAAKGEAIVTTIGVVLLLLFVLAIADGF